MDTAHRQEQNGWLGFSLKSILLILLGIILLGLYIGVLLFGENSLMVLNRLQQERASLVEERETIQRTNQQLQKKYFELLQLTE